MSVFGQRFYFANDAGFLDSGAPKFLSVTDFYLRVWKEQDYLKLKVQAGGLYKDGC